MRPFSFRIVPLPSEVAAAARRAAQAGVADHAFVDVDSPTGFPCRHCLRWAQPGERVVLFPYASIPAGHPYSESGPIFVHEKTCPAYAPAATYPEDFRRHRVMRAYNAKHEMIDAIVAADDQPERAIEELLGNQETAFLQARSLTRGCYTFRIERE